MLHGPNGEDGRIQGLFELAGKPFVGAGSLSSQLAMDKVVAKMLFAQAGLKQAPFLYFSENIHEQIAELVEKKLGYPGLRQALFAGLFGGHPQGQGQPGAAGGR